ncbi:VPLPA-CTERM-specific exosortase XrtD [Methylobacter psychrophilus]|uniref:VPLPA-CTERM-specific exosortase XrtD n=1 Tax=Methylobacter psychrophilus TaxID=96941 RepID=UPI0021D516A9|nr:VPLPA-CTERM-specific exosortase XrtD [Methylobacter psychrophilus]
MPLKKPTTILAIWTFLLLLLGFTFKSSLEMMVSTWINVEEYGHGFFIPAISIYFLWIRRHELKFVEQFKDVWPGFVIVIIGLILGFLGGLATLKTVEQYAFIVTLTGLFTIAFGLQGLRVGAIPLLFLLFMVPFPSFILNNLSAKLQLISSWLGVEFIRACDIMVYLEGNVIDLGVYKLQVVEACSGLRYLFPLASLSFLCAYLFKGPFWQKALIFLSSAPLTIFMNSFRIGVIGVMVDNWGTEMAEGFLHDFEGWVVFLLCMALLFVEMWLFSRLSGKKVAFNELVLIPNEWSGNAKQLNLEVKFNKSIFLLLALLIGSAIGSGFIQEREDIIPARKAFLNFPLQIDKWEGRNDYLSQKYLDELRLTDYAIINYVQPESASTINFYSAYYEAQRRGVAVHSPKGCMPGDGWQITQFGQLNFPDIIIDGNELELNRAVIQKGESKQLVYYWFQQRGRTITNEYLVKWYLFYDALTMNRTDGALIRLVTSVGQTEDLEKADQRLQAFIKELAPKLPAYIPGKLAVK